MDWGPIAKKNEEQSFITIYELRMSDQSVQFILYWARLPILSWIKPQAPLLVVPFRLGEGTSSGSRLAVGSRCPITTTYACHLQLPMRQALCLDIVSAAAVSHSLPIPQFKKALQKKVESCLEGGRCLSPAAFCDFCLLALVIWTYLLHAPLDPHSLLVLFWLLNYVSHTICPVGCSTGLSNTTCHPIFNVLYYVT